MHELVDAVDADALAKWQAVAVIDGWGEDWERTGQICATIHNTGIQIIAGQGHTIKKEEFKDASDFVPKFRFEKKQEAPLTPEQWEAMGRRMAGLK